MDLYKAVSEKGTLTECQLKKDQFGRSLGKARVTFESLEQAEKALKELQGTQIKGQEIQLKYFSKEID